jgi:predicted nucleotidyltransferase
MAVWPRRIDASLSSSRYHADVASTLSPGEQQALALFRDRTSAIVGQNLVRIVLFGSRARGEGHEDSDLDVLVLVKDFDASERRRILDAAADVDDETGMRLSPLVMTEARFAMSFPLHAAVERDGISL